MYPIKTENCDVVYKGPPNQDVIGDLWCHRVNPHHICVTYEPSEEELEVILNGGRIELHILKEPIPPVALSVIAKELSEPIGPHGWRINVEPGDLISKEEDDGKADDATEPASSGTTQGQALGQATETGTARAYVDDVPASNGSASGQ